VVKSLNGPAAARAGSGTTRTGLKPEDSVRRCWALMCRSLSGTDRSRSRKRTRDGAGQPGTADWLVNRQPQYAALNERRSRPKW